MGNHHEWFLGGKGAERPLTYPVTLIKKDFSLGETSKNKAFAINTDWIHIPGPYVYLHADKLVS
jgi:hypothetical protein